ncbi:MAG: P-II family nitrogen regulator [Clostridiales bacterium]|nr:P-II family nitrogen regulator [Clostridiales bacterium]
MAALCRDTGLNLVLTNLGEGTATREQLSLYGLDRTEKAVVSAVAGAEAKKQVFKAAKRKLSIDIPGNGIQMAVPVKSVGGGRTLTYLTDSKVPNGGVPDMKFEYELIVAILNEGYADRVMDAARAAGAAGGTVLHARGTGAGETERFFSVSLAEEKDVIYIVSTGKEKAAIMRAISSQAGPETKAGAICFSLPVSSVAGLRRLDDDE